MVKLRNANWTKYGSVQIKDKDLEIFAYAQLKDYDKLFFKKIHSLNIDEFVEFYLEKRVLYYKLSVNVTDVKPLGSTAITDGKVAIINEDGLPEIKIFKQGTIIVDEIACRSEVRRRFTLGHEAWHSQFDLNLDTELLDNYQSLCDSWFCIGKTFNIIKNRSPKDWVEYHANRYSTYLLMPKIFVKTLFSEYRKKFFGSKKRLSVRHPARTWLIIKNISNELNVSCEALAYRLRELKLISNAIFNSLNLNKKKGDL